MTDMPADTPRQNRLRHEIRRRNLTVTAAEHVTPSMLRLTLSGPELEGFPSASPGDHIKMVVPDGAGGQAMRDYTPRRFDPRTNSLIIDFALHDAGPATIWAVNARVGDPAQIAGPKGSNVIEGVENWLLIGDETALPSIGRRVEELAPGIPVTTLVAVPGPADEQQIATAARHRALWVHRADPTDGRDLQRALAAIEIPPRTFVWIAAEATVARALRDSVLGRGHPPAWTKAAGYWVAGQADASAKDL
ncbi:MAG: siderophore-interacting protein [Paracoccaceae bacterium]